ncbi:MAG TPA: hypothetical protein VKX28_27370 [Xanthobacteraceae bacterium]|nr:hypothetical protein [Xanthobacteraceae bacterium]
MSAPFGRWRVIVDYAGCVAELSAAIAIGLLIVVLALTLDAPREAAATGPVADQHGAVLR